MGDILQGSFGRGKWSKEKKHFQINALELLALKYKNLTFTKNLSHLTIYVQVGNKVVLSYLLNMGSKNQKINLKLYTISSDHNFCIVPYKEVECQSSVGVQEYNRFIRLDTSSEFFSENNQTLRNPSSRPICFQVVSPTFPIHDTEARSKQFCNRCNAAGLEQNFWFCIPTLQPDRLDGKVLLENVDAIILVTPTWQT